MFSAFQYFEAKQLSLAGLCYIMTMAFMCAIYYVADRPDFNFDKKDGYFLQINYSVSLELSDELQKKDVYLYLSRLISRLNMRSVSYTVECNDKHCLVNFIPFTNTGKQVASSAQIQMQNLQP